MSVHLSKSDGVPNWLHNSSWAVQQVPILTTILDIYMVFWYFFDVDFYTHKYRYLVKKFQKYFFNVQFLIFQVATKFQLFWYLHNKGTYILTHVLPCFPVVNFCTHMLQNFRYFFVKDFSILSHISSCYFVNALAPEFVSSIISSIIFYLYFICILFLLSLYSLLNQVYVYSTFIFQVPIFIYLLYVLLSCFKQTPKTLQTNGISLQPVAE